MTKREWQINLGIVLAIWFLDYSTKWLAVNYIRTLQFYGPLGFVLHYNPGAMLGAFSSLPPVLRIVSLSTGGAFLFCIYIAIQHLIPVPARTLRIGMSILLGGILGNVTDRIVQGAVTDFILIGSPAQSTPAFNLADLVQWVGYAMIVFSLIKDGSRFWPEENVRNRMWVNPKFQIKYISTLLTIGLGYVAISGVFFYTYLKVTIDALVIGSAPEMEQRFLVPFYITFIVIAIGFLLLLFAIGRILSHRTAGPLFAFELYLEDLLKGKDRKLRLRAGDEFQHLEELADRLRYQLLPNSNNQVIHEQPEEDEHNSTPAHDKKKAK